MKKCLNIYILHMKCLRNHFGSETTIIPSSPALLSNITVSGDTTIEHQDHTILNIDTLEVKIILIFSQIHFLNLYLFHSIYSVI